MEKLGPIRAVIQDDRNHNPNIKAGEDITFILFHGFGADAYDLKSLTDILTPSRPTRWVFPQGILEVPVGPGWTGRAWWPIDMIEWERAMMAGRPRELSDWSPPELPSVRTKVFNMIEALKTPWSQIILGGFSQGAMLATDIFLSAPSTPKGLVLFSGALINKADWKQKFLQRTGELSGTPFFQSHGQSDNILSYKGAQQLESFLCQNGLKGKLHNFAGGHEIPMDMVMKANEYLKNLG